MSIFYEDEDLEDDEELKAEDDGTEDDGDDEDIGDDGEGGDEGEEEGEGEAGDSSDESSSPKRKKAKNNNSDEDNPPNNEESSSESPSDETPEGGEDEGDDTPNEDGVDDSNQGNHKKDKKKEKDKNKDKDKDKDTKENDSTNNKNENPEKKKTGDENNNQTDGKKGENNAGDGTTDNHNTNPTDDNGGPRKSGSQSGTDSTQMSGNTPKPSGTTGGAENPAIDIPTNRKQAAQKIEKKLIEQAKQEAAKNAALNAGTGAAATGAGAAAGTGAATAGAAAGTTAGVAAGASLAAPILMILLIVLIVVVILIIVVGIIMFLMTAPGMVTEKARDLSKNLLRKITAYYGADTTTQFDDEEVYDVLNYLENMGYDLKGYGFITSDVDKGANVDPYQGVERDPNTGDITEADSAIIGLYLMSDNYVYTVKNFNQSFGFWASFFKIFNGLLAQIVDKYIDTTAAWGKGLISIYYENGDEYENDFFKWNSIEIDPEKKTLIIRRGWGNDYIEYPLDGWTGRYGMPLEFLLSVHLATMKPDLTFEMVTTFDTDVRILLKDISDGEVKVEYQTESGEYKSYTEIEQAIHPGETSNWLMALINSADDWGVNIDEANALRGLGIYANESCSNCEKNADGTYSNICDECEKYYKNLLTDLGNAHQYTFDTYLPYIEKVTNHWFRDVYFKLSEKHVNGEYDEDVKDYFDDDGIDEKEAPRLTNVDLNYEALTNERWTLYEKDNNGNDKLYIYDETKPDGIGDPYPGTLAEAQEKGDKVVKKQEETYAKDFVGDIITLEDDGSWFAYEIQSSNVGERQRLYDDSQIEEGKEYRENLYTTTIMEGAIVQKDDGLRGVTNQTIKDMFLNRYYFSYDGTTDTANAIKELRDALGMTGKETYGEIDPGLLEQTHTLSNGETVQVKDYVSTVSITQDSLAAFSMLENTHTLDADYIYKDFKELIVELGYFEKEQLTDAPRDVLQFLVPDIPSYGYPLRFLDKKENEYGTFLYSEEDYLAAQMEMFDEIRLQAEMTRTVMENGKDADGSSGGGSAGGDITVNVSGSIPSTSNPTSVINPEGAGQGKKTQDVIINGVPYEAYWQSTNYNCTLYSFAFMAQAYTGRTVQDLVNDSSYWSSAGFYRSSFGNAGIDGQLITSADKNSMYTAAAEALSKGAPVYFYSNFQSTAGYHAVVLVGADSNGKILYYDPWGGTINTYGSSSDANANLKELINTQMTSGNHYAYVPNNAPPGTTMSGTTSVEELGSEYINLGAIATLDSVEGVPTIKMATSGEEAGTTTKTITQEMYMGFKGGEKVVSPVTGILLEYGTYTDSDEDYRKNADQPGMTDKVGYAKILVLNKELSSQFTGSDMEGYGLFAEDYEYAGIAGYLVYVDGFKASASDGKQLNESLYEKDKVYNLTSDTVQTAEETKASTKESASPIYSFTGSLEGEVQDLIIIKEGTVLGTTMSNSEFAGCRTGTLSSETDVQGNYLRIIMRDLDDTVVENVEDYMKLDEPKTEEKDS